MLYLLDTNTCIAAMRNHSLVVQRMAAQSPGDCAISAITGYNPGSAAIHYGLQLGEWGLHPWAAGQIAIVGNVVNHGPDTRAGLTLFSTNGTPCEVRAWHLSLWERLRRVVEPTAGDERCPNDGRPLPKGEVTERVGHIGSFSHGMTCSIQAAQAFGLWKARCPPCWPRQ
jgi:hypothetical protein